MLADHYVKKQTFAEVQAEFINIKQKSHESLDNLVARLIDCSRKYEKFMSPPMTADDRDDMVKSQLILSVRDRKIAQKLGHDIFPSLKDALAGAKRLVETDHKLDQPEQKVRQVKEKEETSDPLVVTPLEKKLQRQLDELRKEMADLKMEKSKEAKPKTSPRPPRRNGGSFTCFNCRQPGHRFRECPEPLKERLKQRKGQHFKRRDGPATTRSQESQVDESLNC